MTEEEGGPTPLVVVLGYTDLIDQFYAQLPKHLFHFVPYCCTSIISICIWWVSGANGKSYISGFGDDEFRQTRR
jgi:hypothetical protein